MTIPKDDVCYGCKVTTLELYEECTIRENGFKLKCPCIQCLVTRMCETSCKDYTALLSTLSMVKKQSKEYHERKRRDSQMSNMWKF
jgi:hypothetical protein